jgi:hypothetical protein
MVVKLGIWAGGDSSNSEGTIEWAGGETDYDDVPFTMYVKSVNIINYNPAASYNYTDKTGSYTSIVASNSTTGSGIHSSNSVSVSASSSSASTSTSSRALIASASTYAASVQTSSSGVVSSSAASSSSVAAASSSGSASALFTGAAATNLPSFFFTIFFALAIAVAF